MTLNPTTQTTSTQILGTLGGEHRHLGLEATSLANLFAPGQEVWAHNGITIRKHAQNHYLISHQQLVLSVFRESNGSLIENRFEMYVQTDDKLQLICHRHGPWNGHARKVAELICEHPDYLNTGEMTLDDEKDCFATYENWPVNL